MEEIKVVLDLLLDRYDIYDILDAAHEILDEEMEEFKCLDCSVNTLDKEEYYMVNHELWESVNPDISGMLCWDCLETRMGRKLVRADFPSDLPINEKHLRGSRFN